MRAILTFHSIDDTGSVVSCSQRKFALLLDALAEREIPVCDLETLLRPDTRCGVAITFDDGMRSVYRAAKPVLEDYGVSAHVFITTGAVGGGKTWPPRPADIPSFEMLDWHEIEQLHNAGVIIESHTHTHPDMRTLTQQQMADECGTADAIIEKYLGRRPRYFAYPFGYHGRQARQFAGRHYQGAVTTELRMLGQQEDSAAIPRIDTYYLQSDAIIKRIDSLPVRGYLAARNVLRNWRGSQCAADSD